MLAAVFLLVHCSVKRAWLPNVQRKKLWSDILERHVVANVTTSALRQVDRCVPPLMFHHLQELDTRSCHGCST